MILRPASISFTSALPPRSLPLAVTSTCFRRAPNDHRPFSSTSRQSQSIGNAPLNHYEVLKLPMQATHADLKRQFYILSKETHPDVNRNDPKAADRFAQISESYAVLANPEKRKVYDRDVMRAQQQHDRQNRQHSGGGRSGTHAGHRPASGLSRRRSVFKGPPPSFYANGGGGNAQAQQEAQARAQQAAGQEYNGGTFNAGAFSDDPNAAFDSRPTYKTQTHEDYRRANRNRRQAEFAAAEAAVEDDNFWARFIIVSGIIALGVGIGTVVARMASLPTGGGLTRGDGSRRTGVKNEWTKG